jgi:UDP-glucose 4-epimerase
MKILVTGGAGFIGSHLADFFLKQTDCEVCCLDNFDSYYDPQIKKQHIEKFLPNPRFELVNGDLRDTDLLKKILADADYVFHEAAQAGIRISVRDPRKTHEVNATGTLKLLDVAKDTNVRKIINASSSSIYGKIKYLPFDEVHPAEPVSPYGISKLMAEQYCRVFEELYGLKSVSLRYFTVYGPHMRPDLAIHIFMQKSLNNDPIVIFGDGTKSRDITYIDDVVRANVLAMKKGSGAYNIGGGHAITIGKLAEKIIEITKSESAILYKKNVPGDVEHTSADTRKAERELGWKPAISLYQGLENYKQWIQHGLNPACNEEENAGSSLWSD